MGIYTKKTLSLMGQNLPNGSSAKANLTREETLLKNKLYGTPIADFIQQLHELDATARFVTGVNEQLEHLNGSVNPKNKEVAQQIIKITKELYIYLYRLQKLDIE